MKPNRIIALIFLAFVGWWTYLTFQLPVSNMYSEPGPRFFPLVVLGFIAILSILLFFIKDKSQKEETVQLKDQNNEVIIEIEPEDEHPMREVVKYYGVFLGVIALVYFIGFIPGVFIGLSIMLYMIGWKLFPRTILFSSAVVLVVYGLFQILMNIPLPTGKLF